MGEILKYLFPKKLRDDPNKKLNKKGRPYLPIMAPDYSYVMDLFFFKTYYKSDPEQIRLATRMYIASKKRNKDLSWNYENIIGGMLIIETTSRKIWCYPITGKKAEECFNHFLNFLDEVNYNITNLTSDNGKEFSLIKQYNDIHHLFHYRQISASQGYHLILSRVDRGVRTIKEMLRKHFFKHQNDNMEDSMDIVVHAYNNTVHHSLYYWVDDKYSNERPYKRKQKLTPNNVWENPILRKYVKFTNYLKRNENYKVIDAIRVDGKTEYYFRIYNKDAYLNKGPKEGWLSPNTITLIDRIGNSFRGSNGELYNYYDLIPKVDGDIYLKAKYGHKTNLEKAVDKEYDNRNADDDDIDVPDTGNPVLDRLNYLREKEVKKGLTLSEKTEKRRYTLLTYKNIINFPEHLNVKLIPVNKELELRKEILEFEDIDEDDPSQHNKKIFYATFSGIILKIEEERNQHVLQNTYIDTDDEKFDKLIYNNFKKSYFLHEKKMSPVAKAMRNSFVSRIFRKTFPEDDNTRFEAKYLSDEFKEAFGIKGTAPLTKEYLRKEYVNKENALRKDALRQADDNDDNSININGRTLRKRGKRN